MSLFQLKLFPILSDTGLSTKSFKFSMKDVVKSVSEYQVGYIKLVNNKKRLCVL